MVQKRHHMSLRSMVEIILFCKRKRFFFAGYKQLMTYYIIAPRRQYITFFYFFPSKSEIINSSGDCSKN